MSRKFPDLFRKMSGIFPKSSESFRMHSVKFPESFVFRICSGKFKIFGKDPEYVRNVSGKNLESFWICSWKNPDCYRKNSKMLTNLFRSLDFFYFAELTRPNFMAGQPCWLVRNNPCPSTRSNVLIEIAVAASLGTIDNTKLMPVSFPALVHCDSRARIQNCCCSQQQ